MTYRKLACLADMTATLQAIIFERAETLAGLESKSIICDVQVSIQRGNMAFPHG